MKRKKIHYYSLLLSTCNSNRYFKSKKSFGFINENLTFSFFLHLILTYLQKQSVLLKRNFVTNFCYRSLAILENLLGKCFFVFHNETLIVHKCSQMFSWNTHKSKVFCEKERYITIPHKWAFAIQWVFMARKLLKL